MRCSTSVCSAGFVPIAATIEKMRNAVPRPTNATAAALLWTYGMLPAFSHSTRLATFRVVGGDMERLIWAAAGYQRSGDKFHAATDRRWWERPFAAADSLWRVLGAMARAYDNEHPVAQEPPFQAAIASGDPKALKAYLTLAWETLQAARAKGAEAPPRAPIGVPKLPKKPPPVVIIPPPGTIPPPPLPIPPGRGGGGLLLLGLLALAAYGTRRGRR